MRQFRTTDEVLTDEALTLCLLAEVEQVARPVVPVDRTRLQTLCFLVGYRWFSSRRKGLNYAFFRYRHGPFTRDLYQTEVDLAAAKLIVCERDWVMRLTPRGKEFADQIIEETLISGDNTGFWHDVRDVVEQYAHHSTAALMEYVFALEITPLGWQEAWPLSDIPIGADLTRILETYETTEALEFDPGWLDTFGATLALAQPGLESEFAHAV